ncbi:glycosyltransferase 87 family protein [Kitasatospora sp. NPDC057500]|uniref:glycosyltransferase 87 family protein n=1 Tax=Kitasatospora sp. NPDC057500 TaxID=3346151 RepID=UPI0036BC0B83
MIAGLVAWCLAMRGLMMDRESRDFTYFLANWYRTLDENGGFQALKESGFSDYNVPYLYLLAALTYLPVSALTGIKVVSIAFDLLLAFFAFRIVALRHPRPDDWQPIAAGGAVLLLPTVAFNSGWWGQADSIYTSFIVGSLYFVLRHRPWWACAMLGFALAFKLQTVFVFPFLLVLLAVRRIPWYSLLALPGVYLALDVPAVLLGTDPVKLLTVYARQTESYQQLTLNAPSVYQFIDQPASAEQAADIRGAGVVLAGAVVLTLVVLAVLSRAGRAARRRDEGHVALSDDRVVLLATCSAIVVPYLLPSMHDRYFYVADVLTLIAAFLLPRRLWFAPVLTQVASLAAYLTFLRPPSVEVVAEYDYSVRTWVLLAVAMGAAAVGVVVVTFREFRRHEDPQAGTPEDPAVEQGPPAPAVS